jgi:hypothetical protein
MGVVFRCNQPTRYMTATGAAKRAKRKANNINSFSMATSNTRRNWHIDPRQNKPSRTNLFPAERTNSFTFEIKLKLDEERAVSALTNRRISLSNKSSSTP